VTDPLPDTWHSRDLPVLREVVRGIDQGGYPSVQGVADATGLTEAEVDRAAANLRRAGLVRAQFAAGGHVMFFQDFAGQALELVGAWPTPETALDRMLAALEAIAENTEDEAKRSWAQRTLTALRSGSRDVVVGVAAAAITGQLPG
jgi:N-acetylmuramic acid 6-phosphate (MurNAc-6-P) etherase